MRERLVGDVKVLMEDFEKKRSKIHPKERAKRMKSVQRTYN